MIKNIKFNKKALAALFLSGSLALGGCDLPTNTADCDITVRHAHLYDLNYGNGVHIHRYLESELIDNGDYKRKEGYILLDDEDEYSKFHAEYYNNYHGFIVKIDENKEYVDYLKKYVPENYINKVDYKCYGEVFYPKGTDLTDPMNRLTNTWEYETYYSKNPDHKDATGEKRLKYYSFYGYNLIKNDNGYELVKSEDYYTIDDVIDNCEYIGYYYLNDKKKTEDQELIEYILERNPKVKSR